jgi:tetratricopeptide (TPR) repeat protein
MLKILVLPLAATLTMATSPIAQSAEQEEVIFKDKSGRVLTKQDLLGATGKVSWEVSSKRPVPTAAKELHELGRQAGQQGKTEAALDYFSRAAKAAPEWPYPIYDAAFTHLLQRQYAKAYQLYRQVDQLAPRGFFTSKTALHSLQQEKEGKIPEGTYLAYLSLEWIESAKRPELIQALVDQVPSFASGWKARAQTEQDPAKRLAFLEKGLAADPDAQTKGFLLLNKAAVLQEQGKTGHATAILGSLALDPASPLDIEALARYTLANLSEGARR